MSSFSTHDQQLRHRASESMRRQGTETERHGTVEKVEEKDGVRKALIIWGYKPDGTPCKVWANSQEQRSGQQRSQDAVKPGQNVTLQGADLRQATFTPQAEADHAPQPKHAPDHNGPTQSVGKMYRSAVNGGEDEDDQQQQGSGGGGAGGSSSGGQQQKKKYPKEHFSVQYLAKEPEKLKKWTPSSGKPEGGAKTGSQSSMSGKEQPQQEQKKEEKEERAMQQVMHEKEGFTNVIGKGDSAQRMAVHPKGFGGWGGKDNHFIAEKDGDSHVKAKQNNYVSREEGENFVDKPWVIKKPKKPKVPTHDLA